MNRRVLPVQTLKLRSVNIPKERIFKSLHFKLAISCLSLSALAITGFYFAKKDINTNRLNIMKVKQELGEIEIEKSEKFQYMVDKNRRFEESRKNKQKSDEKI